MNFIFYDFEVFEKYWCMAFKIVNSDRETLSQGVIDDRERLIEFVTALQDNIFVGFNNVNYDDKIMQWIISKDENPKIANDIIITDDNGYSLKGTDLIIYDVYTRLDGGLKKNEGKLGLSIVESEVAFSKVDLTPQDIEDIQKYCIYDVDALAELFYNKKKTFDVKKTILEEFNQPIYNLRYTNAGVVNKMLCKSNPTKFNDEHLYHLDFPNNYGLDDELYNFLKHEGHKCNNKYNYTFDAWGVEILIGAGGVHGGLNRFNKDGRFLNIDVKSYYPALMIEHDLYSRNAKSIAEYKEIFRKKVELGEPQYKLVLNTTYGLERSDYYGFADKRRALGVCMQGQFYLLVLANVVREVAPIVNINTDGILLDITESTADNLDVIMEICAEWEKLTRFTLDFEYFSAIRQRDVNNYAWCTEDGYIKTKGAEYSDNTPNYIKTNIINTLFDKEWTNSDNLIDYQYIVSKGTFESLVLNDETIQNVNRAYYATDGHQLYKQRNDNYSKYPNMDKVAIYNDSVLDVKILDNVDIKRYNECVQRSVKRYYIDEKEEKRELSARKKKRKKRMSNLKKLRKSKRRLYSVKNIL